MIFQRIKKNIFDFDCVYLTYDEPLKNDRFQSIKKTLPHIQNIDGVKGFDKAHKNCAQLAKTNYVTIIDGDNSLISSIEFGRVAKKHYNEKYVLSFASKNSINGLIYGNGGVKCWPKELILKMRSHEHAKSPHASTDFCFIVPYYQFPQVLTQTNIHLTPLQAFRAGYREGVKMCLENGVPLKNSYDLFERSQKQNLYRLKVWCEVGRHVENGEWAIYGARLGALTVLSEPSSFSKIQDYDVLESLWKRDIAGDDVEQESSKVLLELNKYFYLNLGELNANQSLAFGHVIKNPRRKGLMTL